MGTNWLTGRGLLVLAIVLAGAVAARSQTAPATYLEQQRQVLGGSGTAIQREEAARKILRAKTADARQILRDVLWDAANRGAQVAAARALASDPAADASMVEPLLAMMTSPDADRADAAAQALANYAENGVKEAWDRLSAQASNVINKNRSIILRAMGRLADQRAAAILVAQVADANNDLLVRNAAADAFVEMTGLDSLRRDFGGIEKWWTRQGQRMRPGDWRQSLNERKASRAREAAEQLQQLVDENRELLGPLYEGLTDARVRTRTLMQMLNSKSEYLRLLGAEFAGVDKDFGRPIAPEAGVRLRGMIADSSRAVRQAVARTLSKINDNDAVDAMIAQFRIEPDVEVRTGIADGLGPMRDLRATDTLIGAMDDESGRVAEAAAGSLRPLAQRAVEAKDAAAVAKVGAALQAKLKSPAAAQGTALRDRIVAAMAPLGDRALLQQFLRMLVPAESSNVRKAAIEGLEQIGDSSAANSITRYLDPQREPVPIVRLAATKAIATLGGFEDMGAVEVGLFDSDNSVAEEAWRTIVKLAEKGDADQVRVLADRLTAQRRLEAERRAALLLISEKKLAAADRPEELANLRQSIGDAYMKADKPAIARKYFEQSMEYLLNASKPADSLVLLLLDAMLKAGSDDDATKLCQTWTKQNVKIGGEMWAISRSEIIVRHQRKQYARAVELIDKMLSIQEFARLYADEMNPLKQQIEREQKNGGMFWWPHRTRFALGEGLNGSLTI